MAEVLNKWSGRFFADLGERVGATFLGALLGLITLSATTPVEWTNWAVMWPVLGVPTLVSLIKGLLANLAGPETGASLIPEAPPGPVVQPEGTPRHFRGEGGYASILAALGLGLIVLTVLLLVTTLLKVYVVSWIVLIVLFVVGLVLLWLDRGTGRRVV